jgi:hypothetical protein
MEILDASTIEWTPSKTRNKYPWDEWLDGQPRKAVQGVDFQITPESFRSAVKSAADSLSRKRTAAGLPGIAAHAKVHEGTVTFQAYLLPAAEASEEVPSAE